VHTCRSIYVSAVPLSEKLTRANFGDKVDELLSLVRRARLLLILRRSGFRWYEARGTGLAFVLFVGVPARSSTQAIVILRSGFTVASISYFHFVQPASGNVQEAP